MNSIVGEERIWLFTRIAKHTNKFPIIVPMIMNISTLAVKMIKLLCGDVEPSVLKFAAAVTTLLLLIQFITPCFCWYGLYLETKIACLSSSPSKDFRVVQSGAPAMFYFFVNVNIGYFGVMGFKKLFVAWHLKSLIETSSY